MLGRRREHLPAGARRASPPSAAPLDLSACADALEARGNGLYQRYFMQMLAESYRRRHRARPDLFAEGRERGLRTVREYDDRITAPFGGYESAAQYYERSSAGPWLASIDRPALVLAAADDPMIPAPSVGRWPLSPFGAPRDRADRRPRRLRRPARKPPAGSGPPTARSTSWSPALSVPRSFVSPGDEESAGPPADSSGPVLPESLGMTGPYGAGVRTGRRDFQTVAATSAWPSAVGWMPSGWLRRASPATPSSRNGHERRAVRLRQLRVDGAEAPAVVLPVVRQRLHGREHELRRRLLPLRLVDDRLDVLARGLGLLAPQAVVRPRLDDEHGHGLAQEPAPCAAARRPRSPRSRRR